MNQVLHIFKKDVRRHYLEILLSLAFLALFIRRQLYFWPEGRFSVDVRSLLFGQLTRIISPILLVFWVFLIVRVIQTESLVGDRQWWVTKPYEWEKLLLAKLLFIFTFITVPLGLVQLFLLHHAGYPLRHSLPGVLLMQFTLPLLLILFSVSLACLTRNLGQALIGVGLVMVVLIVGAELTSRLTLNPLRDPSKFSQILESFLPFAALILVPIWQFARRHTWASRGTLAASFAAAALISILPSSSSVEKSHPFVVAKDAPAQFAIESIPQITGEQKPWPDSVELGLRIPVTVSGVAPGTLIFVDGINIAAGALDDARWSPGWSVQFLQIWPEDRYKTLTYSAKRTEYEKIKSKPLNLHIQLLLEEYEGGDPRTLLIPPGPFRDRSLGICWLTPMGTSVLQCVTPFRAPAYIARFDAPNSPCAPTKDSPLANLTVGYAWGRTSSGLLPDAGLNPLVDHTIYFGPVSVVPEEDAAKQRVPTIINLCPGAEIRVARPVLKRQVRIQFDLPNTRLEDLVPPFPGGLSSSYAIGIGM